MIARKALFVIVLAALVVSGGVAGAAERATGRHGERATERAGATIRDRVIRLDRSWDDARACSVTAESGIRCFESAAEMAAATGSRAGSRPQARERIVSAAADCNGISHHWLYLYDSSYYGGRIVQFNDVNYWQNLGDYGFDNRTSSWWNDTDCYTQLADGAWGGGALLGLPPVSWQGSMGWWDNRASSLLISG